MMDNEYDPVGGHTKEEAEVAYAELYRELHGEDLTAVDFGSALSPCSSLYFHAIEMETKLSDEFASELLRGIIKDTEMFKAEGTGGRDREAAVALALLLKVDIAEFVEGI
jgi:inorganic pyrophosphatase/exopolyphosphatase